MDLGTRSVDAYEAYLRGLAYERQELETGDPKDTQRAYAAFERARQLDPQFAAAHWQAASQYFSRATRVGSAAAQSDENERARLRDYLVRVDAAIASSEGRPENLKYRSARALVDYQFPRCRAADARLPRPASARARRLGRAGQSCRLCRGPAADGRGGPANPRRIDRKRHAALPGDHRVRAGAGHRRCRAARASSSWRFGPAKP